MKCPRCHKYTDGIEREEKIGENPEKHRILVQIELYCEHCGYVFGSRTKEKSV